MQQRTKHIGNNFSLTAFQSTPILPCLPLSIYSSSSSCFLLLLSWAEPPDAMDIAIQHPWFRRALGSVYPARVFDQFFGEGLFDYDLFPYTVSTISPYYRQSLFRSFLDSSSSGISEVREGTEWRSRKVWSSTKKAKYTYTNQKGNTWW